MLKIKANRTNILILPCVMASLITCYSCKKKDEPIVKPEKKTGKIEFIFEHHVDGEELQCDTLKYVNSSGNQYMVNEVQYFISNVELISNSESNVIIDDWEKIHYTDTDIKETLNWQVYDPIPTGHYDSVSFIFGITEKDNQSFMYVNPPERDMFWPTALGGGYHYLKLNGKWLNSQQMLQPFDFHLGIGQIYSSATPIVDSITGFVQNYFNISLPISFDIKADQTTKIKICMNISSWFKTPHDFDLNYWGGYIMQNQEAMQKAKENGMDIFSITTQN